MTDRIEALQELIDRYVADEGAEKLWFVQEHIDEVAAYAEMIAARRGLDPEVARMSGMLHDVSQLVHGYVPGHAAQCAEIARELLAESGLIDDDELETIVTAVKYHSKKRAIHDPYSEVLKDADTLSHNQGADATFVVGKERERYAALKREFDPIVSLR